VGPFERGGGMRRLVIGFAGLAVIVILGVALDRAIRLASIGAAYKAKMLCSGVFVSGRDPQALLADLEVDDLAMLRYVSASIDRASGSVTATLLGIVTRRAVYRDGLGCALAFDRRTPDGTATRGDAREATATTISPSQRAEDTPAADIPDRTRLDTVLQHAFDEPNPLGLRRTRAIVIAHGGHIVAERYAAGIGPETPLIGWSMTKSVMNALAGILVKDGRLSLDGRVSVPEWGNADDPRGPITLDQLLRMSSGLQFDEDMSDPQRDVIHMLLGAGDTAAYAAGKRLTSTPGTAWQYSSGTTNILARVIRNVLADDRDYWAFPHRALFKPLGMTGAVMETDAAGTFIGSSFMFATARDWARFGMLYLQDGVWDGRRILPEGWVAYTRSPAPSDSRRHYGAHFWLAVPDEYRGKDEGLPEDAFHAAGHEAQFVTVVPSRHAVIVRLGLTRYADAWDHVSFVRDVLAALE
jgi:CubicO group peptidase (beta-lactamase class C family)